MSLSPLDHLIHPMLSLFLMLWLYHFDWCLLDLFLALLSPIIDIQLFKLPHIVCILRFKLFLYLFFLLFLFFLFGNSLFFSHFWIFLPDFQIPARSSSDASGSSRAPQRAAPSGTVSSPRPVARSNIPPRTTSPTPTATR